MTEIDAYAFGLLEMSKRFLEKGKAASGNDGGEPCLAAALLIGVAALEAHVNAVGEELLVRGGLSAKRQVHFPTSDNYTSPAPVVLVVRNLLFRCLFDCLFSKVSGWIGPASVWWRSGTWVLLSVS
jgi:hypothetical protein